MAPCRAAMASGPSCQRVPWASSRKRPTRSEAVMSSLQATVIKRLVQLPGHVFDKARLATTGRALEHHGHAHRIRRLVQLDLVGHRAVVGLLADAVGVEVVAHGFLQQCISLWPAPREPGERLRSCPPPACGRLRLDFTAPLTPTRAPWDSESKHPRTKPPVGARAFTQGCRGTGFAGPPGTPPGG